MSTSRTTALAAVCLVLSACGGGGTEPRCCVTLEGTWESPAGHLTLRLEIGSDVSCTKRYGYCTDTGRGTYVKSGGTSGSFVVSGLYFVDICQPATITMTDSVTNATSIFGATFVSGTKLTGTIYPAPETPGLFGEGQTGEPMVLEKQ